MTVSCTEVVRRADSVCALWLAAGQGRKRSRNDVVQPDAAHRRYTWWTRLPAAYQEPRLRRHHGSSHSTLAVSTASSDSRTDADTSDANFIQAIANTAGFHFAFIEQGEAVSIPASRKEPARGVLRIVLSIGVTEICHLPDLARQGGNAPHLTNVIDPVTGVSVTFPDLNSSPFGAKFSDQPHNARTKPYS